MKTFFPPFFQAMAKAAVGLATVLLLTTNAFADDVVRPKTIRCGDSWFGIKVDWRSDDPVIVISGNGVNGTPTYVGEGQMVIDARTGYLLLHFDFGDNTHPDQTLVIQSVDGRKGPGVYTPGINMTQTNFDCLLY